MTAKWSKPFVQLQFLAVQIKQLQDLKTVSCDAIFNIILVLNSLFYTTWWCYGYHCHLIARRCLIWNQLWLLSVKFACTLCVGVVPQSKDIHSGLTGDSKWYVDMRSSKCLKNVLYECMDTFRLLVQKRTNQFQFEEFIFYWFKKVSFGICGIVIFLLGPPKTQPNPQAPLYDMQFESEVNS